MTENEIGRALRKVDKPGPAAAHDSLQTAHKVIQRDRWRIRLLAGVATMFWVLTVAGVVWLSWVYFLYVVPRLDAYAAGRLQLENDWNQWIRAFNACAEIILACMAALLLAAVSTLLLVFASRRATLRQINANLAAISEELKQLRQSSGHS